MNVVPNLYDLYLFSVEYKKNILKNAGNQPSEQNMF